MKTNQFLATAVMGVLAMTQGAQANGVSFSEKMAMDNASAQVGRDLETRLVQFEAENMDLDEMKQTLLADLSTYGMPSEMNDEWAGVMDRFENRDQLIKAVETTISHQAIAGATFFANTRWLLSKPSDSGLQTFGKVVIGCFTVMADLFLIPTTVATDVSNFIFSGSPSYNSMAYLQRSTAGNQSMTEAQNAAAAWVSLVTVPTDILLTPFYTVATVYKTIEASQRH